MFLTSVKRKNTSCIGFLLALILFLSTLTSTLALPTGTLPRFPDCTSAHPYYPSISALSDLGVVSGTGDGCITPDRAITKAEYTALLVRLFYPDAAITPSQPWHLTYQNILLETGIFQKQDFVFMTHPITWEFLYTSALWAKGLFPYPSSMFEPMPQVSSSNLVTTSVYTLLDADVIYEIRPLKAAPTRGETMDFLYRLYCTDYLQPDKLQALGLTEENFLVVSLKDRWWTRNQVLEGYTLLPQKYTAFFARSDWDIVIDEIGRHVPQFSGAAGLFSSRQNTIYIDCANPAVILHEFGHYLWWFLDLQPYADAMYADSSERNGLIAASGRDYGAKDPRELFAEAFSLIVRLHRTEEGRARLMQYIPKTYAAVRDGLLEAEGLVDYAVLDQYFPIS